MRKQFGPRRFRAVVRDVSGQALVEFALVMPIFLFVLFGIATFGEAWRVRQSIGDAARHGARTAALASSAITSDSVRLAVRQALSAAGLDTANATITVGGVGGAPGSVASVAIDYDLDLPLLHFLSESSDSTLQLSASVAMRHE